MTQTVLLAGATGMLGSHIARHLIDRPEARLRLLVRGDAGKGAAVGKLLARGAEQVDGNLADPASLDRATQGVDVIVSAVQGGPEIIIDGQLALAEMGRRNGARRFLPSDYALDLFKSRPGEHLMFDLRRQADQAIAATGIEHVHVLQGAFMEMFRPGAGAVGDDGVVRFWGDGTQPIDTTSIEDTARMVAHVALDQALGRGKFAFAGDRISILDATVVIEARTARRFERRSLGSEADLRRAIARAESDPQTAVMLAYQLTMLTGETALSDLQNERYPDVKLERFAQFVARTMPGPAASDRSLEAQGGPS